MFDEAVAVLVVVLGFVLLVITQLSSLDSSIVNACKAQGYWQTGQTRVICSVEQPKTKE